MSKRTYHPDRGDLIELTFNPAAGREIDKRRPAVVLSPQQYNPKTGLCLAVPITSDLTPGPLWLSLPEGYLFKPSLVLCDFIKSVDYRERAVAFISRLPEAFVEQVVANLLDVIDPLR